MDNTSVNGFLFNGTTLERVMVITEAACNALIQAGAGFPIHWDSTENVCFDWFAYESASHPNENHVYDLQDEEVCFFKGEAHEQCISIKVSGRVMWLDAYGSSDTGHPGHCGIYIESERLTLPGPIVIGEEAMNQTTYDWNESILDLMADQQYIDWDLDRMNAYAPESANAPSWCTAPVFSEYWWASQLAESNNPGPFDADGDGVADADDQCPNTPVGATIDAMGCEVIVDADGDGVADSDDQCPNTPAGTTVDVTGCEVADADGDGVADSDDQCPNTPAGETVDANGCSSSQTDTDGDGIVDANDLCANTPAGETVNTYGCSSSQIDTDGDGLVDSDDQCPNTPAGETVDANGCSSSETDTDGDGVADADDQCPNTPAGTTVDETGCETLGTVMFNAVMDISGFHIINDEVYFFVYDSTNGVALWKDDPSVGATLVKVINSNPTYMSVYGAMTVGNTVYFIAEDGTNGFELWKGDGTGAGTAMVKDIYPGSYSSFPTVPVAIGTTIYFTAQDGVTGTELWKSDGTASGTVMVKDIRSGSGSGGPSVLTVVGDTLFFRANDGTNGNELWKSDGTAAGTTMVKDINSGGHGFPDRLTAVGDVLYFTANDGTNGAELWKSDGTASGTVMVKDIYSGSSSSNPAYLTAVGTTLYFTANDGAGNGTELWKSDGAASGTVMVKDVYSGSNDDIDCLSSCLTAIGNTLYFAAYDEINGCKIWKSDGTESGTVMVDSAGSDGCGNWHLSFGASLYFLSTTSSSCTGWVTDGTPAGTLSLEGFIDDDSIMLGEKWLFINPDDLTQYILTEDTSNNLISLIKIAI
jgi:ELWxxDGT repeat protein